MKDLEHLLNVTFKDFMRGDIFGGRKMNKHNNRREWTWTELQEKRLEEVKQIINELSNYLPITLRQLYYQLVSKGLIENKTSVYTMLSTLIKHARIDGHIPWSNIEDRTRTAKLNIGWDDKQEFLESDINNFLEGYNRHKQLEQDNYIEIWIEKDALSSIFQGIAKTYCIPVIVCKGFSSISFLNDLKSRILTCQTNGQQALMLYFGDFDPSGEEMLPSMITTLESEMGLFGVIYKKIALNKQDIIDYDLPNDPDAVKKTDKRYEKFVEKYGLYAVELDALPPNILEDKIVEAIQDNIDMELYQSQWKQEKKELLDLSKLKEKIEIYFDNNLRIEGTE